MSRLRADLCLFLAALIWGTAFVAQKLANETMGPVTFVGLRFLLSTLTVAPLAWVEARRSARLPRGEWRLAWLVAFCLTVPAVGQQVGLTGTSATNAGFLTSLYVLVVPVLGWFLMGTRIRRIVVVACLCCVAGAWLLTADGAARRLTGGDALILAMNLFWALHITLAGLFLSRAERPLLLAFLQFSVAAAVGIGLGLAIEPVTVAGIAAALPAILFAGIVSGGVAYTLQLVAQRHTPPTEASLILSLESVFAAVSGALFLNERLTGPALIGCALILAGVLMVRPEADPAPAVGPVPDAPGVRPP